MKKVFLSLAVAGVLSLALILGVSASQYTTSFTIGKGGLYISSSHDYTPGENTVSVPVTSYTEVDGLKYTMLTVSLNGDYGNVSSFEGSTTFKVNNIGTYNHNFGYKNTGKRNYSFSTRVDGYSYGGLTAQNVIMSSGIY